MEKHLFLRLLKNSKNFKNKCYQVEVFVPPHPYKKVNSMAIKVFYSNRSILKMQLVREDNDTSFLVSVQTNGGRWKLGSVVKQQHTQPKLPLESKMVKEKSLVTQNRCHIFPGKHPNKRWNVGSWRNSGKYKFRSLVKLQQAQPKLPFESKTKSGSEIGIK